MKKLRHLSFFMKTMLTKNQRNLLKLRSSKFIPSSDDGTGVKEGTHIKVINEEALLKNYVDELVRKHDDRDTELLKVTGLHQILELLNEKDNPAINQ